MTATGSGGSYAYDANGNQVSRSYEGKAYSLAYDGENRLVSIGGAATASFVYDGDGQRVKGTVGGVTTVFVGEHYEVSGSAVTKYYYAGGSRVALRRTGGVRYLFGDHLGSTSVTADGSGGNVSRQLYKAWGETRGTGRVATEYGYTGQYGYEDEFGLLFYRARWYAPLLSQFSQPDTLVPDQYVPLDWNRYQYARANPVKFNDPTGHCVDPDDCPNIISDTVIMIACGVGDGPCGAGTDTMQPAYNYAVDNGYQVYFYDPDTYNKDHAKYDMAQDISTNITGNPDNDFYLVGYSAGGGATVLAAEMSGYADNIKGVGLIDPALDYTDLNRQTQELQDQANRITQSGITLALANSSKQEPVSISGAVLPKDPFSYDHGPMGTETGVFDFIFKAIMR